jgi:tetratricopeptide (TPR) repeat protein
MTTKSLKYNLPFAPSVDGFLSAPHHTEKERDSFFPFPIEALMKKGEEFLLQENPLCIAKSIDFFQQAIQLQPDNPEILLKQGTLLFEYPHTEENLQTLLLSIKKFKAALFLNPSYFEAWLSWGRSLFLLGVLSKQNHYFIEAEKKIKQALSLANDLSSDLLAEIYWDYGIIWTHIGDQSKEAIDLATALSCFKKCSTHNKNLPCEFWNIYGKTYLKMADKVNDVSLIVKAIDCFKQNIFPNAHCLDNIVLMADSLGKLYFHTQKEAYFLQAQNYFKTAATQVAPSASELWHKWALFLLEAGRKFHCIKKLKKAFHKCQQALALNPNNSLILVTSAEILACLGAFTDKIHLIRQSQETLEQAIAFSKEKSLSFWHSYGECLYSYGSYFQDLDYYYQAIEKFQENTSVDSTSYQDWYALGRVYATIGEMNFDTEAFETSINFYSKAFHLKPLNVYCLEYAFALTQGGNFQETDLFRKEFLLHQAIVYFEYIFEIQKHSIQNNLEPFFHYATALNSLGECKEDISLRKSALEKFFQIFAIQPNMPHLHYHIGLTYSSIGETLGELEYYIKAIYHYNLEFQQTKDDDTLLLNWGIALINIGELLVDKNIAQTVYLEAEKKLLSAALLGNEEAFYQLGCLYTILGYQDRAMHFIQKSYLANVLPPVEELLEDDWLEDLYHNPDFQDLISRLEKESSP